MNRYCKAALTGMLLLSMLGTAGCGSGSQTPAHTITVICKSQDSYWDATKLGAQDAGEEMNLNVIYEAPEREDSAEQYRMISEAISAGTDAIVLAPVEPDAFNDVLQQATAAGIPVLTIDSDVSYADRASCISTQNVSAAAIAGRYAVSLLEDGDTVGIISHAVSSQTAQERTSGFIGEVMGTSSNTPGDAPKEGGDAPQPQEGEGGGEAQPEGGDQPAEGGGENADQPADGSLPIPDAPAARALPEGSASGFKLLQPVDCGGDTVVSRDSAMQMIRDNPDLDLIYATNQPGTAGVCEAVATMIADGEIEAGQIKVVGFDYFGDSYGTNAYTYVTSGVLNGVIAQNPYNMGYLGVRYAEKLVNSEDVAATVDTGAALITADNINDDDIQWLVDPTHK
ncbi:MAG: substrate-binding domain-containing protein [Oscillospiraceae bacterium]|nr:substrate-binding domain-containing protein [Oscillospiraceae bacterium]